MARYRIYYEKRGAACFVPHIVLPNVFTRSGARAFVSGAEACGSGKAALRFQMTEGFSPRAKMSFASELPVGVVALREAADVWLEGELTDGLFRAWSDALPTGFRFLEFELIPDGSPSLSKSRPISEYLIKARSPEKTDLIRERLRSDGKILSCGDEGDFIKFTINNNALTLGTIVKAMISDGLAAGWHDLCIVRLSVT